MKIHELITRLQNEPQDHYVWIEGPLFAEEPSSLVVSDKWHDNNAKKVFAE